MRIPISILVTFCAVGLALAGCGDDSGSTSDAGSGAASNSSSSVGAGGQGGQTTSSAGGAGGNATSNGGGGAGSGGAAGVWQPALGTTWQWQLTGLPIDQSFEVTAYDVDLYETSDSEMTQLKAAGRVVICYFSAGSWEQWRPDAGDFPESVKGGALDPPFTDEKWLDIRTTTVRNLMAARLDLAVTRGCDAVEPDNVDGYTNGNGFGLSAADQLDYNTWIAQQAHARNLSVGLKNDVDQLDALEPFFDWALNEECYTYSECGEYADNFVAANKAVFHAEYVKANQLNQVCSVTQPLNFSTLIKDIDLDAYQLPCP